MSDQAEGGVSSGRRDLELKGGENGMRRQGGKRREGQERGQVTHCPMIIGLGVLAGGREKTSNERD